MRPKKKSKPVGEYILNVLIVLPLTLADPEWGGVGGGPPPIFKNETVMNQAKKKKHRKERKKDGRK